MKQGTFWAVTLVVCAAVAGTAMADPETVDFDSMMADLATFEFMGDTPYEFLVPATADNNTNGILDAIEFAMLSEVFANPSAYPSYHDTLHEAWKANALQLGNPPAPGDLGGLANSLVPNLRFVLAAYVVLGDGDYGRFTYSGSDYGYGFEGSWGIVAETIFGMEGYGSAWQSGAPADADYSRQEVLASACGDLDGDGVNNINEYYGQGEDRAAYVAAVTDPGATADGGDPDDICSGGGGPSGGSGYSSDNDSYGSSQQSSPAYEALDDDDIPF